MNIFVPSNRAHNDRVSFVVSWGFNSRGCACVFYVCSFSPYSLTLRRLLLFIAFGCVSFRLFRSSSDRSRISSSTHTASFVDDGIIMHLAYLLYSSHIPWACVSAYFMINCRVSHRCTCNHRNNNFQKVTALPRQRRALNSKKKNSRCYSNQLEVSMQECLNHFSICMPCVCESCLLCGSHLDIVLDHVRK